MDNKDIVEKYHWFTGKANIERKQHQLDGIIWCVNNELLRLTPSLRKEFNHSPSPPATARITFHIIQILIQILGLCS